MSATAKLFMHGRSQAVRLPKEFRFEGTEVRVSKVGDKVILEPVGKTPFDAAAWRASLAEALTRGPVALPAPALHELWYGAAKSARIAENVDRIERFLSAEIVVLP